MLLMLDDATADEGEEAVETGEVELLMGVGTTVTVSRMTVVLEAELVELADPVGRPDAEVDPV